MNHQAEGLTADCEGAVDIGFPHRDNGFVLCFVLQMQKPRAGGSLSWTRDFCRFAFFYGFRGHFFSVIAERELSMTTGS